MAGTWPALNVREHGKITTAIARVFPQIMPVPEGEVHNGFTAAQVQLIVALFA